VTEERRRLSNEEPYDLYSSLNIIRMIKSRVMRWAGHVARMGDRRVRTHLWWGDLREGSQLGGPRHRWEDSIKMDLEEGEWEA